MIMIDNDKYKFNLDEHREVLKHPTGISATKKQKSKGKLSIRDRIELLYDQGTFQEIASHRRHDSSGFGVENKRPYTDGVVAGWGEVNGQTVFMYGTDFRVLGGTLSKSNSEKIQRILDLAYEHRCPVVSLNDGAGARIQEGVEALDGFGKIFSRIVRNSTVVPQISAMLGPCAGGAAYAPALTHCVFMVDRISTTFITGPDVIAQVTGEQITPEELGGASVHAKHSGLATFVVNNEEELFIELRYLLSLLPQNSDKKPQQYAWNTVEQTRSNYTTIVPTDPRIPYDMRDLVDTIVDVGSALDFYNQWGRSLVCALCRIEGRTVGIIGNNPKEYAGVLDIEASEKGARFIDLCNTFGIPIVTLVDVPGFMPGRDQESGGIIVSGARLLKSYCEATVPRIQVIIRKAYGGAYIVMDSKSIGTTISYAWPQNEIAVMGAEGAVSIIHRREINQSNKPEETSRNLIESYKQKLMHPLYAAERGLVDEIIQPEETRSKIASTLRALQKP